MSINKPKTNLYSNYAPCRIKGGCKRDFQENVFVKVTLIPNCSRHAMEITSRNQTLIN